MNPQQSYSGENFDRVAHLALFIASVRRYEGRSEPAYGYSDEDWKEAQKLVQTSTK